jgi:hypothetical protein|tara:strand:- start:7495 stop:7626 length:132 start_codon:yes stop_codon:yes gene_type:complete
MADWQKWVIVIAGIVAVVGHWVTGIFLDVIGGAVAAIVGFMLE